jgi:hypothetical protein
MLATSMSPAAMNSEAGPALAHWSLPRVTSPTANSPRISATIFSSDSPPDGNSEGAAEAQAGIGMKRAAIRTPAITRSATAAVATHFFTEPPSAELRPTNTTTTRPEPGRVYLKACHTKP